MTEVKLCKRGHRMTHDNTYTNPKGWAECRECIRLKRKAYRENEKKRRSQWL